MEQGGSSKQQAINQRGRRQGVVRQAGHSGQEVEGRGDAPTPAAETEATNPVNKKRKSNANGPRQTSKVWKVFNRIPLIPGSDPEDELAACKHCHKKNYIRI
ncbi:hypothetical protein P8452_51202 [Trifolium repens]|nr:hypothetical protein P8452_51202 [Trifolium repens]